MKILGNIGYRKHDVWVATRTYLPKVSCDDNGWIPVQGRLPEDNHKGIYDMQLVTLEDGEVCMGVYNNREKEWWTRKQEGERWYTNKHNVIAWQPLPEPYKEEKKC